MFEELEDIREKYKDDDGLMRRLDIIEKKLKVLEIIKEKNVDIVIFKDCKDAKDYNAWCDTGASWSNEYLTQEEFDLLKEELL